MILFEIMFWLLFFFIIYIYIGYPLTIFILSKIYKIEIKDIYKSEEEYPEVSLIIPAYNEEVVIEKKIKNVLSLDYPKEKLEVWVMSDGSTDRTDEIVKNYANKGIKLFRQEPRAGKVNGLNKVVKLAKGEIIVFTDANSMYEKDAIKKLVKYFKDEKIGLVCGRLRYLTERGKILGETFYWKLEDFLKRCESNLGELLVVNGSIYAVRKDLYLEIPGYLADDFIIPMNVGYNRKKAIYEPLAITSEFVAQNIMDEFKTKVRIITRGLHGTKFFIFKIMRSSPLRFFEFLFHKFFRWIAPIFLMLFFFLNIYLFPVANIYKLIFTLQIFFYFMALIGYLWLKYIGKNCPKIFLIPFYFVEMNFAAIIGILKFLKGEKFATWDIAQSTRK